MILQNYYHILWLDNTSTQKQISKRGKEILKYLAIWENPEFENDFFFTKEFRKEVFIKEAVDNLNNSKNRLINFFFWFDIDDQNDKKIFELINKKDFLWAISTLENTQNSKNLAILFCIILLNKDLINFIWYTKAKELVEKTIKIFYYLSNDEKFWKKFEQKFYLYDDISTDKNIINEFRKNLWEYLSDIFYDISKNLWDNITLKVFSEYFKNITWNKINKQNQTIYLELSKIADKLEKMNISEDWIFDNEEKKELEKTYKKIISFLDNLKDIWLYEDSKTLVIRDKIANSLRTIMLDLNNELNEEKEALKVLKFALEIVWTDWLKHKINDDYRIVKENIDYNEDINNWDTNNKTESKNNDINLRVKESQFWKTIILNWWLKLNLPNSVNKGDVFFINNKKDTYKIIIVEIICDLDHNKKDSNNIIKPAFLYTLNWIWVSIYWNTTYLTILWIPIIPISSWNVKNLGNNQYI